MRRGDERREERRGEERRGGGKACEHASSGDSRVTGVYSSSREHRAMASGGSSFLYLNDLYELVHPAVPGEDGLAQQQLGQHAASRPDVDVGRVVGGSKDELRGAISVERSSCVASAAARSGM
ncbi:hypothetical protein F7725_018007, partial [Dissostichus mawsoni]